MKDLYPAFDLLSSPLSGNNLIEAGAGTGKTYTIACIYVRLIVESRLPLRQILVVTFTEAATDELRTRVRDMLVKTRSIFLHEEPPREPFFLGLVQKTGNHETAVALLTDAINGFDEAAIFTIHGFCRKVLHDYAFESKTIFSPTLAADQTEYVLQVFYDFWRNNLYDESLLFLSYADSKGFSLDKLSGLWHEIHNHPLITVLPEKVTNPDTITHEQRFTKLFTVTKEMWNDKRDEITKLLLESPSLNRNRYRKSSLTTLFTELDMLFSARSPLLPLPKNFNRITRTHLAAPGSVKKNGTPPEHDFFERCDDLEKAAQELSSRYDRRIIYYKKHLITEMERRLPELKRQHGVLSFDDLLANVYTALTSSSGNRLAEQVRAHFKAALIDESQDTDPVQHAIFTTFFGNQCTFFLIGDPKQSIYAFRGADIFAYIRAKRAIKKPYGLLENWRSEPRLISAINALFSPCTNPFLIEDIPYMPIRPAKKERTKTLVLKDKPPAPFQLWFLRRDSLADKDGAIPKGIAQNIIIKGVVNEITHLLSMAREGEAHIGNRPVHPSDIAVLVRKKSQALALQEALSLHNVACVVYSDANLFDSDEAADMYKVLQAIASPGNESLLRTALVTSLFGIDGKVLYEITQDDRLWESWFEEFCSYHDLWHNAGFMRMFGELLHRENVRVRLLKLPNGERCLTNLLHLGEVLHENWRRLGPSELVRRLGEYIDPSSPRDPVYQLRLERDENAVTLATIHKSKGLEYPIVFVPFCWEGINEKISTCIFHDTAKGHETFCDLGSSDMAAHREAARFEQMAENIRLLYVAVTRARFRCYLVWGYFKGASTSAFTRLFHTPDQENSSILTATEEAFKALDSDEKMLEDLRTFQRASEGIGITEFPSMPPIPPAPESSPHDTAVYREFRGTITGAWRVSSFSALTSRHSHSADIPDYDALSLEDETVAETGTKDDGPPFSSIVSFPRGTKAGSFLHSILETIDFTDSDTERLRDTVARKLSIYGFEPEWNDMVCSTIKDLLRLELPGSFGPVSLQTVSWSRRLTELEFYFPLKQFSRPAMAELFSRHSNPAIAKSFPDKIEQLEISPIKGFIKGYVDLIFAHNNRFYCIDWKSNYLGPTPDDYTESALVKAMSDDYYIMQYHLYLVALHRYLHTRLPDYDYSTHMGDTFYIFLRGVDPAQPAKGVFRDRPSKEFIEALSEMMIGEVEIEVKDKIKR
ncbi:MAG: exodeoxyribonuclease V subunit beta [Chitinivibrionales bacterium]|nr:exodeoxyribonuclease V subunit beta [Chitinivibrionales bacterium]